MIYFMFFKFKMGQQESKNSIVINNEGIFLKGGKDHMQITKDGLVVHDGRHNKFSINKNTVVNNEVFTTKTTSTICINNECIQFDCNDRVKLRDGNIYCGNELYYKTIKNTFVDQRS